MGTIWNEMQEFVHQKTDILIPFHQDMSDYFSWVKEVAEAAKAKDGKPEGYERRPTIGLRLQLDGNKVLAIRPGWRSPGTYSRLDGVQYNPARYFPGDIVPGIVSLELLGPGKLLSSEAVQGQGSACGFCQSRHERKQRAAAHDRQGGTFPDDAPVGNLRGVCHAG